MLKLSSTLFNKPRNLQIFAANHFRGLSCSPYSLSSNNNRRRSLVQTGSTVKKKDVSKSIIDNSQLLTPSLPEIVQLRPITGNTYPFTEGSKKKITTKSNSSQQSQVSSTCPSPPPTCPPTSQNVDPPSSRSPPFPPPPPPNPPPNQNNSTRNILLGLLAGGIGIGGLYYMFGDSTTPDSKTVTKKAPESSARKVMRNPRHKEDFPKSIPYVLIGGGTASFAAFRAIKSRQPNARVLVISGEDALPYMRPPLSKEIWYQKNLGSIDKLAFKQWNGHERSIFYEPPEFYTKFPELMTAEHGGVSVATGWVVSKVDASAHTVEIEDPQTNSKFEISYEKCLIATGSRPKNLPVFEQASPDLQKRVVLYRNLRDLVDLWSKLENVKNVAIVGGGFLGSELACALANKYNGKGLKIQQIFKESGNMGHVLPGYLAEWTTEKVRAEGVNVITGVEVKEAGMQDKQVVLTLSNESCVKSDVVIVAVGSEPNVQLADTSFLEVHDGQGGFLVNAELEARTDLYAAGDVACFYDPTLGRRRVEHHDHAVVSGRLAGENMTGAAKGYKHQSMFWSDLGQDVGYEAIGVVDSCLPTVAVFAKGLKEKASDRLAIDRHQESGTNESIEMSSNKGVEMVLSNSEKEEIVVRESKTMDKAEEMAKLKDEQSEKIPEVANETSSSTDYNKGVIFYLKSDMIVGIVLWNVFNRMHIARQVLAEKRKYSDLNEVAKLFKIHEEE